MRSDKNWLISTWTHTPNLDQVIIQAPASSDFGLGARILQMGWFYRPKWKFIEKSASKNKHPIKFRFSNWSLQSDNPEKKVIPEKYEFGSYPLLKKAQTSHFYLIVFSSMTKKMFMLLSASARFRFRFDRLGTTSIFLTGDFSCELFMTVIILETPQK